MSQAASGYERIAGDRYFTPAWPVRALVSAEKFNGISIDPCAGGWGVVEALIERGLEAAGFDIEPPPSWQPRAGEQLPLSMRALPSRDFLSWDGRTRAAKNWCNIITNPPYGKHGKLAVKFIEHALELVKPRGGKVAMLLRVDFDSAHSRRHIFHGHHAFKKKYVITKRIRWTNFEQKDSGPTENHAWFVWSFEEDDLFAEHKVGYGNLP